MIRRTERYGIRSLQVWERNETANGTIRRTERNGVRSLRKVGFYAFGMLGAFDGGHQEFFIDGVIKAVVLETRRDVQMIVPHILAAARLVVLSRGKTVASIRAFEGNGNLSREALNVNRELGGQVENVLIMRVWDDENVWRVARVLV